jgi:hypothetical protein
MYIPQKFLSQLGCHPHQMMTMTSANYIQSRVWMTSLRAFYLAPEPSQHADDSFACRTASCVEWIAAQFGAQIVKKADARLLCR